MRQKTVKIFNEKLNFREKAESKIKSFENFNYHNKETNVEVFNDRLPWIRQNKSQPPEDSKNKTGTKSGVDSQNKNEGKENLQMRVRNINEDKSKSKQNVFSDSSSKVNKIDSNQKNINYTSNHSLNQNQGQKRDNNNNNKIYYNSSNNDYLNSKNQSSKSKEYGKQDRDTSTETDKVRKVSIEIQSNLDNENFSKKLKRTMIKSVTIPEQDMSDSNEIFYFKNSNFKTNSDELITNKMIGNMFPSLPLISKENRIRQYGTYAYRATYRKYQPPPHPVYASTVIHAGIDFLDQYWANKRKIMLKKEDFHPSTEIKSCDDDYSIPEKRTSRFYHYDSHNDSVNFQELYNKKLDYDTRKYNKNMNKSSEHVEIITNRDLENII